MSERSLVRSAAEQTFVLSMLGEKADPMTRQNVIAWQEDLKRMFFRMNINCPIEADGIYGPHTRAYTADLAYISGMSVEIKMPNGEVTADLRRALRNSRFTPAQRKAAVSRERQIYRDKLLRQYGTRPPRVHAPTSTIISDVWGWFPGTHDGVDICTPANAICFAMIKSKIVDVRVEGWFNIGAPNDPTRKDEGDAIIQMEVLENIGPFRQGMHIGYGHAERATVRVGQVVSSGQMIGHVGFANARHIHLLVTKTKDLRGVGTQDPRPLLDYAIQNN